MPVDSHILMPASIMKGFCIKGKTKQTYALDIETLKIEPQIIKKYGNVYGYYSDNAENILFKTETTFGEVKKNIIDKRKVGQVYDLTDNDLMVIRKFLTMEISRNRTMSLKVQRSSIFCDPLGIKISKSDPIEMSNKMYPNGEFFDRFSFSYVLNETDINFVCPENCMYSIQFSRNYFNLLPCMLFPLSPKIALKITNEPTENIIIDTKEIISSINEDALFSAFTTDSTFIVSKTDSELKQLVLKMEDQRFINAINLTKLYNSILEMKDSDIKLLSPQEIDKLKYMFNTGLLPPQIENKLRNAGLMSL